MFITRRAFIAAGSAAAAGILAASPAEAVQRVFGNDPRGRMTIYRLSLRGRRGSRFARRYNANMRFATRHAAETHRAHRGDCSRIVPVTVSVEEYHLLFASRHSQWVDLREMQNLKIARTRLRSRR